MVASLSLADVDNGFIVGFWLQVYSHLDWKEAVRGRAICSSLRRELPRVVADLRLRCFANASQRVYQLQTIASTFTQLRTLELLPPLSITPQPADRFMDWRCLAMPNLVELTVHTDVAEDVWLLSSSLPKLEQLVLVSKVGMSSA